LRPVTGQNGGVPNRRPSTAGLLEAVFRDAAAIVHAEFTRPLTAAEVARQVASSPRQLRRAFAEVGGTSFRSYVNEVRMKRAAELVASTDMPVKEVARRVGYRQPSQFTKAFKRSFTTTPSQLRNSGCNRPTFSQNRVQEAGHR